MAAMVGRVRQPGRQVLTRAGRWQHRAEAREVSSPTLERLAAIIDTRDPYTGGHSRRVADLSARIAAEMHLPAEQVRMIVAAARLHDIGKAYIPLDLLNKEGSLTSDEWDVMESHAWLGAELLLTYPGFLQVAHIVMHHHERWDGLGYPMGLRGNMIPLGSRIISVADSFDAMVSERSYRPATSVQHAVMVLWEGRGLQWEPSIVEGFLRAASRMPAHVFVPPLPLTATAPVERHGPGETTGLWYDTFESASA